MPAICQPLCVRYWQIYTEINNLCLQGAHSICGEGRDLYTNKSSRVHLLMIKVGKRDWGRIEGSGATAEISLRVG